MATLSFEKTQFERYFKANEETFEKIRMFGIPIEIKGNEIEIEVLPNRPDLLSLQGFVRAISAFIGKKKEQRKYKVHPPGKNYKVVVDSSVKEVRPYTVCAIVKNLKLNDSLIKEIIETQEKLHTTIGRNRKKIAIGIYPLEKIELPIKYEAKKPNEIEFQPLESIEKMNAEEILKQHQAGREYGHLLLGAAKYPIFRDAKGRILSMPPIINSNETGKVTEETKEVFVECSGTHLYSLKKTLSILVSMLADMGGNIYAMEIEYGKKEEKLITPELRAGRIKFDIQEVNSTLGLKLTERDVEKLLYKMGYEYKRGVVEIPAWRIDVMHQVDIIEDIAIAYGYDNLIPEMPNIATIGGEIYENKIKENISNILLGLGLLEVSSYHLVKEDELSQVDEEKIYLASSRTDFKLLRPCLLISAMRIFAENKDKEYPQRIFEIGTVFSKDNSGKSESRIGERENLIIALSPGNFTNAKEISDYLSRMLNISIALKDASKKGFIDGRIGGIILNNKDIGYIGELHPDLLKDMGVKMPVSVIEISLEEIFSMMRKII